MSSKKWGENRPHPTHRSMAAKPASLRAHCEGRRGYPALTARLGWGRALALRDPLMDRAGMTGVGTWLAGERARELCFQKRKRLCDREFYLKFSRMKEKKNREYNLRCSNLCATVALPPAEVQACVRLLRLARMAVSQAAPQGEGPAAPAAAPAPRP